jgi:hypothetical protein
MTRPNARLGLSAIFVTLVVLPLAGCPEPERAQTPSDAFLATVERVEARDFEGEWRWMTPGLQNQWGREIDEMKRQIRSDPGNRQAFDLMLDQQYELNAGEFLETDPRVLHARFLEVNRQQILRYEVAGEARIDGDTALLPVRMLKDEEPTEFRYLRVDGRWLLDEGKRSR